MHVPAARSPRLSRRQRGFSFIEILVVMGIMSLLATMVVVLIPVITERANRTKSSDNLKSLVTMMLARSKDKMQGYPSHNGKCFTLTPVADGTLDPEAPGSLEILFSPGDEYLKLANVDKAKYKEIDTKKLRAGEDFRNMTSYAGRTNAVKGCIMTTAISSEIGTLMLCDDDDGPIHHKDGLMVGFRDGRVEFLKWEELKMAKPKDPANPEPFLGDSSESDMLKCVSSN